MPRREYGSGSVYRRKDGKWIGAAQAGFTKTGGRKRVSVVGRTEAEAKRRLRDKIAEVKAGEVVMSPNTTVKAWAAKWLPVKQQRLSPNGYKALASPIKTWVIPTIGQRRLAQLTPTDIRAVEQAQRDKGKKGTTCAATQRALFNMLRAAVREGHTVPTIALMAPMPLTSESDRQAIPLPAVIKTLAQASLLPHGTRWAVALLMGMRQGECLGLTWDAIDFDNSIVRVEWQLQRIPYVDRADKSKGFRVPVESHYRHLHKTFHLVPPKSKAGAREYPLLPFVADALRDWRDRAPGNTWGLVWPTVDGKPRLNAHDLAEWHSLQAAAGVAHPNGRPYHVHECRNVTATELRNIGADDTVMTALLGHTDVRTSRGYISTNMDVKRAALEKVAALLELG